jgi:hypothetical protein
VTSSPSVIDSVSNPWHAFDKDRFSCIVRHGIFGIGFPLRVKVLDLFMTVVFLASFYQIETATPGQNY